MVVTNDQSFLQGNHLLTSGVKRNGCYVVPKGRSVYTFLKGNKTNKLLNGVELSYNFRGKAVDIL